jgi:hypothetical protein
MTRSKRIVLSGLLSAVVLGLVCIGCQQSSSTKVSQSGDARPPAEQSFDEISQIIKSALETGAGGVQGGFVSEQANARSHFSVHNDVTSAIIRPTSPSEPYRATITVTSHTTYSIRHIPEVEKKSGDKEKKNGGQEPGTNPLDETQGNGSSTSSTDSGEDPLVMSSKGTRPLLSRPEDAVARRADDEDRTYDLVYENGRWTLKTQLDLKTEQAVKNAFDYALKLQP